MIQTNYDRGGSGKDDWDMVWMLWFVEWSVLHYMFAFVVANKTSSCHGSIV